MTKGLHRRNMSAADIRNMHGESARHTAVEPGPESATGEQLARKFLKTLAAVESRRDIGAFGFGRGETREPATRGTTVPAPLQEHQLVLRTTRRESLLSTEVVSFEQVKGQVPVFGASATVELDARREVVSASIEVADVQAVGAEPSITEHQALLALAAYLGNIDVQTVPQPTLSILPHPNEDGALRLTWHFQNVPISASDTGDSTAAVPESQDLGGCSPGTSQLTPDFDYFIDAHSGEVVYFFANTAHIDIPTRCRGIDEENQIQAFFGRVDGSTYKMENPFDDIRTLDMALRPIETTPVPNSPVSNDTNNWQDSNPAAVSAHVNAERVLDFLFRILRRNSIDDNGLALESIVNCVSKKATNPPEWINAVWWNGRMWYGQQTLKRPLNQFVAPSRHHCARAVSRSDRVHRETRLPGAVRRAE